MKTGSWQGLQCNEVCVSAHCGKLQKHPGVNLKVNHFHWMQGKNRGRKLPQSIDVNGESHLLT